tara:strand:+ start:13 stop:717 length:705 start_codon:yes stop_codon:yes gene_type:complete
MLTFNLNRINLSANSKVLDLGCGEGRHIFGALDEYQDIYCVGLDQDIPSLDVCKEGLVFFEELNTGSTIFIQGSVYNLPFEDDAFDLVICSEVLEHLDDYHAAIKEIYRVLKPQGKFLPSVPSYWPERICWALSDNYQNMPGGHVRIFKKLQVINEIIDHGFIYQNSERFHGFHSAYWWLRCLFWGNQDSNYFVRLYKKFLEYHIIQNPPWLNNLEKFINPIFGKSIAFYFEKK